MSTKIYENDFLTLTEYACPIQRRCIQLTKLKDGYYDDQYITFNKDQAAILISELQKWIDNYDSTTN